MMVSPPLDIRLLTACAKVITSKGDEAEIRQMLVEGIDWRLVARKAIAHGLDGLVGNTLTGVAPDMVPEDVLIRSARTWTRNAGTTGGYSNSLRA